MFLLANFYANAQTIRYVNASVSGGANNGTSWANAYTNLQTALAAAQSGDQIWVAKGTYYPTTSPIDRNASFVMINNVGIYGGFSGNGIKTLLSQRDFKNNVTILSGDIDQNDGANFVKRLIMCWLRCPFHQRLRHNIMLNVSKLLIQ